MRVAVHELDAPRWRIRAREAFDPSQPRDDQGQWTSAGGGASPAVQAWAEKRFGDAPEKAKAFVEWFGDSKVVDEQGEPLRVFHGTRAPGGIDAFDLSKAGGTDAGYLGRGFYFGDHIWGNIFAGDPHDGSKPTLGDGGSVLSVFLSIRNPLQLEAAFQGRREIDREITIRKALDLPRETTATEVRHAAIAKGYDGVTYHNPKYGGMEEYVAFHPEQIKSTFNKGTFNPKSPKLSESTADPITPNRTIATAADATRAAQDLLCDKASAEFVPDIAACVKTFLTDARRWFLACDGDCWSPESARRAGIGGAVNQSAARLHTAIMERLVRAIGSTRVDAFTQGIAATRVSSAACVPERVTTGQVVVLREADGENCGTGAGGFQPGNTCGKGDGVTVSDDVYDSHDGQLDGRVIAKDGSGKQVGALDYSVFNGAPSIRYVQADELRRGIASTLVDKLAQQYGYENIEWGMMTPDGVALQRALDRKYGVERVENKPTVDAELRDYKGKVLTTDPARTSDAHGLYIEFPTHAKADAFVADVSKRGITHVDTQYGNDGRAWSQIEVPNAKTVVRKLRESVATPASTVARAVILEPDRTLWLYDADGERGPMLPGGHVERGETAEQAVTRECREETGFEVEVVRWLIDVRDEHSTRHYYLVRRVGGEPTSEDADSGAAVRMRRVSIEDAVTLLVSAFDVAAVRQAEHGTKSREADGDDCGTGAGGFKPGNTCAAGGGSGSGASAAVTTWAGQRWKDAPDKARAFTQWFGDSKVVDDEGEPLRVYHGTRSPIDEFRPSQDGGGIYFTDNPDTASAYAIKFGPSGMDDEFDALRAKLISQGVHKFEVHQTPEWKQLEQRARTHGSNVLPIYLSIQRPIVLDGQTQSELINRIKDSPAEIRKLRDNGYDGIVVTDALDRPRIAYDDKDAALASKRATLYVAFQSDQIKSATGNRGSFKGPKLSEADAD